MQIFLIGQYIADLDITCYDKPVALPNRDKKMKIFRHVATPLKILKIGQMLALGFKSPWHN